MYQFGPVSKAKGIPVSPRPTSTHTWDSCPIPLPGIARAFQGWLSMGMISITFRDFLEFLFPGARPVSWNRGTENTPFMVITITAGRPNTALVPWGFWEPHLLQEVAHSRWQAALPGKPRGCLFKWIWQKTRCFPVWAWWRRQTGKLKSLPEVGRPAGEWLIQNQIPRGRTLGDPEPKPLKQEKTKT